jgi:hypothetical protein
MAIPSALDQILQVKAEVQRLQNRLTSRAMTPPTSRSLEMIFRNYNLLPWCGVALPVAGARPRR